MEVALLCVVLQSAHGRAASFNVLWQLRLSECREWRVGGGFERSITVRYMNMCTHAHMYMFMYS